MEDVKNWDKPDDDRTEQSVVHFIREELRRIDPSLNVIKYHNSLLRRLMDFGKIQTFKDFTHQNVMDFDNYLRQSIKSEPTRYKRHTTLRRFIRIAINRGLCKYDPYMDFRFKKGKSRPPVFLLEEEIERIKHYTPVNDKLQHVKDCFLFQVFTGMAYADIAKFTRADVVEM
ncbi:MAG: site-specific integrase, partial [Tannerellaceae bacterium]|nr:site-specific integrase [Tannerellaceae bacterium]